MLTSYSIGEIGILTTSVLIAVFFGYLYATRRSRYLLAWTAGWGFQAIHSTFMAFYPTAKPHSWLALTSDFALSAAALAFLCTAQLYANGRLRSAWILCDVALFAAWPIAHNWGIVAASPAYGRLALALAVAWVFWQESRRQDTVTGMLLGTAFLCSAAITLTMLRFVPSGHLDFAIISNTPRWLAAILMVLAVQEDEKRNVERNILALTNLNLSTSSFTGVEIQQTLSQALDRVLNVARVPMGAIFVRHGDADGPMAIVSSGLDASFCRMVEEEHLDQIWISLIARMGGLKVFHDWDRDLAESGMMGEDRFTRLRELAGHYGLRTMVCISLQVKEQPCGVLVLATPESRRFPQAQLRLLLALSHQIAMALENSHLVQQTTRRTEELRVINEIGRALSSTLDLEALFGKIYRALQSMFDANNFSIALYDAARNQLCYELEISDGVRLPKHTRPVGNHLAEHILHSGEPLLIRKNLAQEAEQLGVGRVEFAKSFCGVPLMAYDRAIGVMSVYSPQEDCYDEEHLAMMSVLAAEASIAIENARLFKEERSKSQQLTLLNNISRNAIATLNPDEMLALIAEQFDGNLRFDHIGIGLLDYANREIVIQAESGRRRGAIGRRLALSGNLVGSVARNGQMRMVRDLAAAPGEQPVLEGSASAIVLPLCYADQLHGVLYVETAEIEDFSEEEIQLLRTLADLISGALHNAMIFQKAQAQAITDGLTGIKTHRFFMEALAAEWKRSTRGGRTFSLLLIDLDRFKSVNDFHGHLEGDLVLTRIGQLLQQNCRRSDVVARYGGDEFIILMPETNAEQGYQFAEKLGGSIYADPQLREKNVTASLGVATFPTHGSTPQELIQIADASMYLSKHQGGNTVCSASHFDGSETKRWKQDVLEAYLGVTLKRLFSTGPEAFREIRGRLEQFSQSMYAGETEAGADGAAGRQENGMAKDDTIPPAVVEMITALALAIDAKDRYTQGHSQKVADYSELMARRMGLDEREIRRIRLGGLLHDIGKVGIPAHILNKSGPLDSEEWEVMKAHVLMGDQLLDPLSAVRRIREMVLHHHEMFDGSGYPDGLKGEQIPLGSRIIAIADAYDTIVSERTYKKARTVTAALTELERCAGTQFDPQLVQAFRDAIGQLSDPAEPAGDPAAQMVS